MKGLDEHPAASSSLARFRSNPSKVLSTSGRPFSHQCVLLDALMGRPDLGRTARTGGKGRAVMQQTKFSRRRGRATTPRRLGIFAAIGATVAALAVGGFGVLGASAGVVEFPDICHRTGSSSNPYVVNHPNNQGQFEGHADHTGPIWTPGATEWGDIIPPIPALNFPGLNWPEGQAIWENGCKPVETPATTAAPPTTAGPAAAPSAAVPVQAGARFTG